MNAVLKVLNNFLLKICRRPGGLDLERTFKNKKIEKKLVTKILHGAVLFFCSFLQKMFGSIFYTHYKYS
jgi:hypothetical protein